MSDKPNNGFRFSDVFRWSWDPKPVNEPVVDPEITKLDPLSRSAESIRYSILSVEFWISPKGQVREWLRNHTRLAVVLAIPAFLVLPVITFALWQMASWMAALIAITSKLILFPVLALIALGVIWVVLGLIRSAFNK